MSILSNQVEAVERERDELARKLRAAASGNVLFVLRNGFERPGSIPYYRGYPHEQMLPPVWEEYHRRQVSPFCDSFYRPGSNLASHTTVRFRNTGKQDTFGRVIFEEQ